MKVTKFFISFLLAICVMFSFFGCSNNEKNENIKSYTYQHLITKEYSSWQKELINITTQCYDIYKLNCLQNKKPNLTKTDYENIIVTGSFSLYANKQESNYVCFSGDIRVFIKDPNGYWQTNRYQQSFISKSNLGRADFITYNNKSNIINFNYQAALTYLGTFGEGISTYWEPSCINYSSIDILKTETQCSIWSCWGIKSDENWCYRIENEMYYTYNLQTVIF